MAPDEMIIRTSQLTTARAFILTTLAGTILGGCGAHEAPRKAEVPPEIVRAQTLEVGRLDTPGGYVVTGTVAAKLEATLASKVLGRVLSVNVREGDHVRQGQVLVSIDSRELRASANIARANYNASVAGVGSAKTAIDIEDKTSAARIDQAQSQVRQAEAALAAAEANRDLALAGTRTQEITQSHIQVLQAESSLKLARAELERTQRLVAIGAMAKRDLELAQNQFDLAKGRYDAAVQGENLAREGSRSQEIRAAEEAVAAARATVKQAQSGVAQAKAAALQTKVRRRELEVADAQVKQASAAVQAADVSLSYGRVVAPFDGRVVRRLVDPGSMASPGSPLLVVQGGEFRLEAAVPARLLPSLKVGATAPVRIDALAGAKLTGRVVEVVPQGDSVSHKFVVKFALPDAPGLQAGQFGKATIPTDSRPSLEIPQDATWEREGLHYVFALNEEGIARLRIVTLGEAVGDRVEVLSGLEPGERIVVGDRSGVVDGVKVEAARS